MADEKEVKKLTPDAQATVKCRVNGPGSITYGRSAIGAPDEVVTLADAEYKSVKDLVTRLETK